MAPRPLSWDALHVFLAVAQAGSVSAGAQRLGINHSTVLRRLAALEHSLGTRLFDRLPGGYALTASGNTLAERLAGLPDQVEGAQRHLLGLDEAVRGVVRLTTTDTLLQAVLMPKLAALRARHPELQLQVTVNNTFLNLTQREADIAVRGSNRPPENLVGLRVGAIQTALYASRDTLKAAGRKPLLASLDFVGPDDALAHLEQAKWLRRHVDPARVVLRLDSLAAMVDAVAAGCGAGMLLCPLADRREELVQLAPPDPALDTQVWVLTHPELRAVARVRAVAAFLVESLREDAALAHA